MVDQIFPRWNPLTSWMRQIEGFQRAVEHEGAENRAQTGDDGDKEEVRRTLPGEQHHH